MTTVIHIKDAPSGYRSNPDYVYIGRGDKWGNPYHVSAGRARCIELYREYIGRRPELLAALPELKGKTLVCFCKPQACHGDVLAAMAEEV